jgi:hypothetical protein
MDVVIIDIPWFDNILPSSIFWTWFGYFCSVKDKYHGFGFVRGRMFCIQSAVLLVVAFHICSIIWNTIHCQSSDFLLVGNGNGIEIVFQNRGGRGCMQPHLTFPKREFPSCSHDKEESLIYRYTSNRPMLVVLPSSLWRGHAIATKLPSIDIVVRE